MSSLATATFVLAILAPVSGQYLFPDCNNGPLKSNAVCDTSGSSVDRATALVNEMTLAEKLNSTGNVNPGVPRLGLPAYDWWQEALHGVATRHGANYTPKGDYSHATSFPQPLLMGAAFDDELIFDVATVISTEARAFSNANRLGLDLWTPNINPFRDPRWGRGQEVPGEDPFHLQSYVKALITGLQGGVDPDVYRVVATCKHFAAYDLENWNGIRRYDFDAQVSAQDLKEYYMPPFQTCARDAKVGAFMCSYNSLNGVPACANEYLMQTILREHWGWNASDHWVVSDCDAVQQVFSSGAHDHAYAATREQTVADTLVAGTDLNCGTYYPNYLGNAIAQGLVEESVLDQSLIRLYSAFVRLGYFDSNASHPYRSLGWSNVSTPASERLAYNAAAESIVLLKNDGTLPYAITPSTTVALIGEWANATVSMQGNYAGTAPYLHSPLYALQQLNVTVNYATGPGQSNPLTDFIPAAVRAANRSDVIIYIGGMDQEDADEGDDRYWIDWTQTQRDLISQVAALGKPCILVQMGMMLDSSQFLANPNISALLWAGYPGQDGGTAIMDIITGTVAPAGRLPVTQYPAGYVNDVPMTDMSLRPGPNNPGRTYRWYEDAVVPFGFGLHYTNFSASFTSSPSSTYSIASLMGNCTDVYPDRCPFQAFPVNVTNTGSTASDFVTLGFLSGQFGPQPYPIKTLVAYDRLHDVQPGSSRITMLNLTLGSLARVDELGNTVLYPGDYALLVDQPTQVSFTPANLAATITTESTLTNRGKAILNFTLTGDEVVLDEWPQPPEQYMGYRA
ncbi:putative exo-1,4-beta-xylosidase bxlB [Cladophialophora carrionii]|uniref:xylan 1,4-beta-xylosidase n=1 Tax=Cladophialophora carrionii TaxID=86049 RepID=A0A1C1CA38_9EURO|nr:putative exo-1,4-beta-xylosidase bxlB [Cladophialophora carrionii]